jgi:hypothetical protein
VGRATEKALKKVIYNVERLKVMCANGTAIGVVCVTGVANRLIVPVVGMELSRWQAGMAQYLQSRVRLAEGSRYDEARY